LGTCHRMNLRRHCLIGRIMEYPPDSPNPNCPIIGVQSKALLYEVEAWIENDPKKARAAFRNSAAEVIDKLKVIEAQMVPQLRV